MSGQSIVKNFKRTARANEIVAFLFFQVPDQRLQFIPDKCLYGLKVPVADRIAPVKPFIEDSHANFKTSGEGDMRSFIGYEFNTATADIHDQTVCGQLRKSGLNAQ